MRPQTLVSTEVFISNRGGEGFGSIKPTQQNRTLGERLHSTNSSCPVPPDLSYQHPQRAKPESFPQRFPQPVEKLDPVKVML